MVKQVNMHRLEDKRQITIVVSSAEHVKFYLLNLYFKDLLLNLYHH